MSYAYLSQWHLKRQSEEECAQFGWASLEKEWRADRREHWNLPHFTIWTVRMIRPTRSRRKRGQPIADPSDVRGENLATDSPFRRQTSSNGTSKCYLLFDGRPASAHLLCIQFQIFSPIISDQFIDYSHTESANAIAVISFLHICRSLIVPHTHTPNESIVSTLVAVVACHAWLPSTIFICVRLNGNILEDLIGLLYIIISSKWIGLLFWEGTESTVCRVSCVMCDVLEYWIAFWWSSSSFNNNYCAIYIRYSNFSYSSVRLLLGLWSPVASLSLLHTVIRMLAGCVCNEHGIVMILIKNGMEEES